MAQAHPWKNWQTKEPGEARVKPDSFSILIIQENLLPLISGDYMIEGPGYLTLTRRVIMAEHQHTQHRRSGLITPSRFKEAVGSLASCGQIIGELLLVETDLS
jgi:hypothetical protein